MFCNTFKTPNYFQDTYDFKIQVLFFKTPEILFQDGLSIFKTQDTCIMFLKTLDCFQDNYIFKTHALFFQDTCIIFKTPTI